MAATSSQKTIRKQKISKAGTKKKESVPKITMLKDGCRVRHREYLQEIVGSVAFSIQSLPVNPGLASTFPWLAAIASRYESYHFDKLHFQYSRETTEFLTAGKVMLGIDYDATDSAPVNKVQFMALDEAISDIPCRSFSQISKTNNLRRMKTMYVRGGSVPSGADVKLYDIGNLFVATQGQPNTNTQGELYVDYDVTFMTPQLEPSFPYGISTTVAPTQAAPLGTSWTSSGQNPFTYTSGTTMTANQPGPVMVTAYSTGTVLNGGSFTSTGVTPTLMYNCIDGTSTHQLSVYRVVLVRGDVLTFGLTATTVTACVLTISSYVQ
jgi:hypothetical protein